MKRDGNVIYFNADDPADVARAHAEAAAGTCSGLVGTSLTVSCGADPAWRPRYLSATLRAFQCKDKRR